jgi:hypothetical protein
MYAACHGSYMIVETNYPCNCPHKCGLLTAANGTFSNNSGLSSYNNSANCEWMISPSLNSPDLISGAQRITIIFTNFSTQPLHDFVRVFQCSDADCSQQHMVAELSGTYPSVQSVTSNTCFARVIFTSDSSINLGGFTASWTLVCDDKVCLSQPHCPLW